MQAAAPAQLLVDRSDILRAQGRMQEALDCLDRALALAPGDAIAHCKRGLVLKALRRWDAALACFETGLSLQPGLAPAHLDRANVLQEQGRLEAALQAYDRALALQPRYAAALCNRGTVLHRLHRLDEAIASYDAALALEPRLDEARFNRATTLADAGRYDEALQGYAYTLARQPDLAVAHWNEALCRLRLGDFERGWPKFEWRWRYTDLGLRTRPYAQEKWLGQDDLAGRTLLLYAEQGMGDAIQFSRYVPLLAQRGARVVLEAPRPLEALLRTLEGTVCVVPQDSPLPPFDCHTPLMSLPLALGTRLASIPAKVPYLHADQARRKAWAGRLGARHGGRPRIGLAWSGNPRHPNDFNRSLALAQLRPLADLDLELVAVQNEVRASDEPECARLGVRAFEGGLQDFADTAALMANLDLVISVDSAPAHLAGALGLPVWILLPFAPDWRWLLQRADSPWYPSARLLRQEMPRDWSGTVAQLQRQLAQFVATRAHGAGVRPPSTGRLHVD